MNKWQVIVKIWQDDRKTWQVDIIICQVMAEIYHHRDVSNFDLLILSYYRQHNIKDIQDVIYMYIVGRLSCHLSTAAFKIIPVNIWDFKMPILA